MALGDYRFYQAFELLKVNLREIVPELCKEIEKNSRFDIVDESGQTALMHLIKKNKVELALSIANLLEYDKRLAHARDKQGKTPLLYAVEFSNERAVQALLKAGALQGNTKDNNGVTPLLRATVSPESDEMGARITSLLLSTDPSIISDKDNFGNTPILNAAARGRDKTLAELLKKIKDRKEKMEIEALICTSNNDGQTALMVAASTRKNKAISLLLEAGGLKLVLAQDKQGKTALHHAAKVGNLEAIPLLLEAIGSPAQRGEWSRLKDTEGMTALMHAVRAGGDFKAISELIKLSSPIYEQDKEGRTAVIHAVKGGQLEVVKQLFDAGACPFEKDNRDKTALMYAAEENNLLVIDFLLKFGASPLEKDKSGKTALDYASSEEVRTLLTKAKAIEEALQKARKEKVSKSDILQEASKFRSPAARKKQNQENDDFRQFKAKLGLKESDIVGEIAGSKMIVLHANGLIKLIDIEEQYNEQLLEQGSNRSSRPRC